MTTTVVRLFLSEPPKKNRVEVYSEILLSELAAANVKEAILALVAKEKGDWFSVLTLQTTTDLLFVDVVLLDNGITFQLGPIIETIRRIGNTLNVPFSDGEPFQEQRLLYVPPSEIHDADYHRNLITDAELARPTELNVLSIETSQSEAGAGASFGSFLIGLSVSLSYDVLKHIVLLIANRIAGPEKAVLLPFDHRKMIANVSQMVRTPKSLIVVSSLRKLGFNRYVVNLRAGKQTVSLTCNRRGRITQFKASD